MERIFPIATDVSNPLMLAGFISAAFFIIARQIIRTRLLSKVNSAESARLMTLLVNRFFVLAILSLALGFLGYALTFLSNGGAGGGVAFAKPSPDLVKLSLSGIESYDILPYPDFKNVQTRVKAVPKSKNRHVPISESGKLIIKLDGKTREYESEVGLDEAGVAPTVATFFTVDSLIPREDYAAFMKNPTTKAQAEIRYDPDIEASSVFYRTPWFSFNGTTVNDRSGGK